MQRGLCAAATLLLVAGCGLNGTDSEKEKTEQEAAPKASADPDFAEFAGADIPDAEERPIMQLQIVLERQGFGPGVIDGKTGLSTQNALAGYQEANGLDVTGTFDDATRTSLQQSLTVPATRVITIPESWASIRFEPVPEEPEDQAKMTQLGYASIDEKLAERFHTTVDVLAQLNPGGRPATAGATPTPLPRPTASSSGTPAPLFHAGQQVRVPNIDAARLDPAGDDEAWRRTLASLAVSSAQPKVARIVVSKSKGTLKAYDKADKLVALFTVTSGSRRDPLPLGEWGINGVSKNPPFAYNPELFWDVPDHEEKQQLPPGPNGPVGVVWIDLTKEHYGIHGTPEPQTIGRSQSHGCVRLTNWDAARLAQMVSGSTKVLFEK
jgi:lipoprotein-anchoring transpeptidase ErfK/SrfK